MGEPYDFNDDNLGKNGENGNFENNGNYQNGYNGDNSNSFNNQYGNQYQSGGSYSYNQRYGYGNNQQFNNGTGPYAYQAVMHGTRGFSVASLVLGIISVVCCCAWYIGLLLGVMAIIFSVVSRKKNGYFDGLAIAGLVLGIFGTVICALLMLVILSPDFQVFYEEFYKSYYEEIYNQIYT